MPALLAFAVASICTGTPGIAQTRPPAASIQSLKKLSLDELFDVEVTSVSKRPEKLRETASAVQVINGDDIRRSAATSLTEALALVPNLRVAQLNSFASIVSARGFSALFANKLLVLIDGRTVYTPLFAGVFWDVQNVLLEDINRIEVVSGPGGTLWGANAVNGVINITTKSAQETQGLHTEAGGGSFLRNFGAVRYGGSVGSTLFYRVHAQRFERDHSYLPNGRGAADAWNMTSGGLRLDWLPSDDNTLMLQAARYGGTEYTAPGNTTTKGHHVLGAWTRTFAAGSELKVQAYYDRTWRDAVPSTITDKLSTYDLDVQHRFFMGRNHGILWGAGYRRMRSEILNSTDRVGFVPPRRDMELFSGFVQDEITVARELKLTLGTKLEHNVFSGLEVQPSVRLAWLPNERQTVWGALSRAVRAPSRIDVDYHIPAFDISPGERGVDGGPDFDSEKVVAYELGYRAQPRANLSLSLAAFYNRYDDIYSVEALPGTPTFRIMNGAEGQSWGAELSGTWQPTERWRLRGGYTYFRKDLWNKPGHRSNSAPLGNDPSGQAIVQSMLDLPANLRLDVIARRVEALPEPRVPAYLLFDVRLAWQIRNWELSVAAQHLGRRRHSEFGALQIPRGVYGKVVFQW